MFKSGLLLLFFWCLILIPSDIKSQNSSNILKINRYFFEENISECVTTISNTVGMEYSTFITSPQNFDLRISGPFFNFQITAYFNTISESHKSDVYIVILDNLQQCNAWFKKMYYLISWNPNGKFIIHLRDNLNNFIKIFELAWRYYILNILVVVISEGEIFVHTYFPYNSDNCTVNLSTNFLFKCGDKYLPKSIFPQKVPNNLKGCQLRMLALKLPPYVINPELSKDKIKEVGIEVYMLHIMAKKMNFTENYLKNNYTDWGNKLSNGTYVGMYSVILNNNADFMFGMSTFKPEYTELCSSKTYLYDQLYFFAPIAGEVPKWKNFIKIFKPSIWALIFVSLAINSLVWYGISKLNNFCNGTEEIYFSTYFLASWYTLLQGSTQMPTPSSIRTLLIFWTMFSLIVYTSYQCQLISILTKPQYENQISSMEEILNSKMAFGFFPRVKSAFSDPNNELERRISSNYTVCPLTEECVNRTAFKRDFAVIKNSRQINYLTRKYYTSPDGKPLLYGFSIGFHVYPRILARKGFPLLEKFDEFILKFRCHGLMHKWDKETSSTQRYDQQHQHSSLKIAHLLCGFFYLFFGLFLATVMFIVEIIWNKIINKK